MRIGRPERKSVSGASAGPSRAEAAAIRVRDLTRNFGNFTAVDHVSFDVSPGEILGFLGPNGAGKTTTIKKKDLRKIKPFLGYMSQKFSLYPLLTAYENMDFFGGISGLSRAQVQQHKQDLSREVPERILRLKVMDIPPGIRQKVALRTCLMSDPEIVLLDEPTSGVDPENRRRFWMQIYDLKKRGKTVLVTTHNLDEAEYSDRILIIHKGSIVLEGEPFGLMQEHGVDSMESLFSRAVAGEEGRP